MFSFPLTAAVVALAITPPDAPRFDTVQLSTGIRMHYAEQGDARAKPIILLHGYSDSWFSFSRVLTPLARDAHVFALDLRGHGKTDKPKSGYLMQDLAADVIAFMDAKGIVRATIVGHSMGTLVAQQVALAMPSRVSHLVLVGGITTGKDLVGWKDLAKAVSELSDPVPEAFARDFQVSTVHTPVGDEFMNVAVNESLRLPARVWRELATGMEAVRPAVALRKSRIPTLVLRGQHDSFVTAATTNSLVAMLKTTLWKEYPNTGHALHWEQPATFSRDVLDFVAQ
jgi:pimeloyl-ACP methyl ester carboxylesterase